MKCKDLVEIINKLSIGTEVTTGNKIDLSISEYRILKNEGLIENISREHFEDARKEIKKYNEFKIEHEELEGTAMDDTL